MTDGQEEDVTLTELANAHALMAEIKAQVLAELCSELGLSTPEPPSDERRPWRVLQGGGAG